MITSCEIFTDEDLEVFRDIWMFSGPKTNDMWYNKLGKSPQDGNILENLNLARDGKELESGSKCLVLRKYSKLHPKFFLALESCDEKHSLVCRIDPDMVNSVEDAPKFPCITSNQVNRKKRASGSESDTGRADEKGLLLNYTRYLINTHILPPHLPFNPSHDISFQTPQNWILVMSYALCHGKEITSTELIQLMV